jgi:hypothetical protein
MPDKLYYDDQYLDATITASSELSGYGKKYAFDTSPSTKWRTTGITTESMLFDFGTAVLPLAFGWIGSNIVSGDTTYTIGQGTTSAATDNVESMTKSAKGRHEINASWTARRYWKIIITKASGTYVEFGKMALLFAEFEYTKCHSWDYGTGHKSVFSRNSNIKYGQISKEFLQRSKIFNFNFVFIEEAQAILFDEVIRDEPFIFYYYEDKSEVYYGETDFGDLIHNFKNPTDLKEYFSISLSFTEAK